MTRPSSGRRLVTGTPLTAWPETRESITCPPEKFTCINAELVEILSSGGRHPAGQTGVPTREPPPCDQDGGDGAAPNDSGNSPPHPAT
jgi:hypothetical protein